MPATTIKLNFARKKGQPIPTVQYDFGVTAAESANLFTPEVVHTLFVQAARIQLSAWLREVMIRKKAPMTLEEVNDALRLGWKPTIKRRGKSQLERAQEAFEALSAEDRTKLASIAAKFAPAQGPLKLKEADVAPAPSLSQKVS